MENLAVNKYWMCDEVMSRSTSPRQHAARCSTASIDKEAARRLALPGQGVAKALKGNAAERIAVAQRATSRTTLTPALLKLARDVLGTGNVFLGGKLNGVGDNVAPVRSPTRTRIPRASPSLHDRAAAGRCVRPRRGCTARRSNHGRARAQGLETRGSVDAAAFSSAKTRVVIATHAGRA